MLFLDMLIVEINLLQKAGQLSFAIVTVLIIFVSNVAI